MTAEEMQYNFELKLHTISSMDKPFESYDINQFLNKAQDDLVEERYSARDGDRREAFEKDEKVRAELAELIQNTAISSFDSLDSALHTNGAFVDIPNDFLYSLKEECRVYYNNCNNETAYNDTRVKPVAHDEYNMNINNAYKAPYNELVWRLDYNSTTGDMKRHELITDGTYTITSYKLRYLRRPTRINILDGSDCELNSSLHEEIIDRAIQFAGSTLPQPENVQQKTES